MQSVIRYTSPVKVDLPQDVCDDSSNKSIVQNWKLNPYFVHPDQVPAFDRIIRFFSKPDLNKPSDQAKLTVNLVKLSSTIQMVDNLFLNAIEDYRKKLFEAIKLDLKVSLNPDQINASEEFKYAIAVGAARMVQRYTPNLPIFKHISVIILPIIGAIFGYFNQEVIKLERTLERNSAHRQQWALEVAVLEQNRKTQSLNLIKQRLQTIHLEIESAEDLIDMALIDELKALDQLSQWLDPEHSLLINEMSVLIYIQKKLVH